MATDRQPQVVGWLADPTGRVWPGVLLYRDALLVRAPIAVLGAPSAGLQVVIQDGAANRPASAIAEVKLLEVDGSVDDPVTAMIRLASDTGIDVCAQVNRSGFDIALRVTGDVWRSIECLGLIPDRFIDPPPSPQPQLGSQPPPVTTVKVQPDDWCDIFWWLC